MENIILSGISTHLDTNTILNPLQHGFMKRLSCDSQLLSLFRDLDGVPTETDMIVIDFSNELKRLQFLNGILVILVNLRKITKKRHNFIFGESFTFNDTHSII